MNSYRGSRPNSQFYLSQQAMRRGGQFGCHVDRLQKYLGNWYEIVRFDHKFERGQDYCKAQTSDTPAVLCVSFFAPFSSDYRVMMLDTNYQWALVGSNNADYLWILSRTPQLLNNILV